MGCRRAKVVLVPHLAGVCIPNEADLPRCTEFGKVRGVTQGDLARGYVLFPSRASKGLPAARGIARQLRLPLVGNMSYGVAGGVKGCVDFDRFNPYKGARLMVSLTKNDSYNIAIAKCMAFGVPALWDNSNKQIRSIWNEFPAAIPRAKFKGKESLEQAKVLADQCKDLIERRVAESAAAFEAQVLG